MIDDALWQQDMMAALHLERLWIAQLPRHCSTPLAIDLQPTRAEIERAVGNIRAWRSYLPEPCVAKMIEDGWQWST